MLTEQCRREGGRHVTVETIERADSRSLVEIDRGKRTALHWLLVPRVVKTERDVPINQSALEAYLMRHNRSEDGEGGGTQPH